MAKKEAYPHPDKHALYAALLDSFPEVESKGGTMPYTSINGNMFSFLDKEGSMGLRLPKEQRENFIKKYKTTLCNTYGTVLKEYVIIPDKLLKNVKVLKIYFQTSVDYVNSLKPKPTKKLK